MIGTQHGCPAYRAPAVDSHFRIPLIVAAPFASASVFPPPGFLARHCASPILPTLSPTPLPLLLLCVRPYFISGPRRRTHPPLYMTCLTDLSLTSPSSISSPPVSILIHVPCAPPKPCPALMPPLHLSAPAAAQPRYLPATGRFPVTDPRTQLSVPSQVLPIGPKPSSPGQTRASATAA